jgi:hypothetical protein
MGSDVVVEVCTDDSPQRWGCIVCYKKIHRGDSGCPCSTTIKEAFHYASICATCAEAYNRIMSDEILRKVHEYLVKKKYWEGAGPVIDF